MRPHALGLTVLSWLVPSAALAGEPEELPAHRPTAAFTMRVGSGTWTPIASRGIDEALTRAGLPPLGRAMPTFDVGIGGDFGPVSIELQAGGVVDVARDGPSSVSGMRAFVVLGYRLFDDLPLSIMPTVGVGTTWMKICPQRPGAGVASEGSAFDQLLSNPGPATCLYTGDTAVLRGGLAFDLDALFDDTGMIGGVRLRLEPAIEVPFRTNTWEADVAGDRVPIDGPLGPPIGFSLGVSIGGVLGF